MKVLIADDDGLTRKLLEGTAEKWGYEVVAVADGVTAWEELRKGDGPRLALLDWMMPGMTGLALCEKLKQSTEMPYVYVILLTSKSGKEDIVQGLDAGADDFLTKPVSSSELRSRLAVGVRILSVISPMASPGPHVEGYEIIGPLGKGARGIVYRAIQNGTRREVALKLIRIERVNEDEKARFLREVELTAKLDHPNTVRIYSSCVQDGVYGYAMELVDGVDIANYVKEKGLGERDILRLMQKVCSAVGHAHARGIIHRDLKPGNVLVTRQGDPKIVDFGLAKSLMSLDEGRAFLTEEGLVVGTPAFMAPEQAAGRTSKVDTRTDVYGLGILLYRLLLNEHPHDLKGPLEEVLRRVATQEIRPPRLIKPDMDSRLAAILTKALARDPRRRYATANELAMDLETLLSVMYPGA